MIAYSNLHIAIVMSVYLFLFLFTTKKFACKKFVNTSNSIFLIAFTSIDFFYYTHKDCWNLSESFQLNRYCMIKCTRIVSSKIHSKLLWSFSFVFKKLLAFHIQLLNKSWNEFLICNFLCLLRYLMKIVYTVVIFSITLFDFFKF